MWTIRLCQLVFGLVLYGFATALMIRGGMGLSPWSVFHQGLADVTGLSFGTITVLTGIAVLVLWIPLRQRPGLGTILNTLLIGPAADATLAILPAPHNVALRLFLMMAGIVLTAAASALYIGAAFEPGPRDGLMTGLSSLTGRSMRLVRTAIEVVVLVAGFALGGTIGIGTVAFAVMIGPLFQMFRPLLRWHSRASQVSADPQLRANPKARLWSGQNRSRIPIW
jgi:uncharacterized membrane protein YczE